MLQHLLDCIKKDLPKTSSAASQMKSSQFAAVVDQTLCYQPVLLSQYFNFSMKEAHYVSLSHLQGNTALY